MTNRITPEQLIAKGKERSEWLKQNNLGLACPSCAHQLGSLAQFCNQCGTAMPQSSTPVDPRELADHIEFQCNKRGHMMQQAVVQAKFCACCGSNLQSQN